MKSSSRRSPSVDGQQTGSQLPAAAVAEPGAQHKPGRQGTSGIGRCLLLPRHNGGEQAAERGRNKLFRLFGLIAHV